MHDDRPFPTPFGAPAGPSLSTAELFDAFLAGARTGVSPDAHIEYPVLMASDHLVAVHCDVAVLVRQEVPAVARSTHAALCRALEAADMVVIEQESVLASALVGELAVPRGFEWNLWARDASEARDALVRRVLGEAPGALGADAGAASEQDEIDAVLERLERDW